MTGRLLCAEFGDLIVEKTKSFFFVLKLFFYSKHFDKYFHDLKNQKNSLKTEINSNPKTFT